MGEQDEPLFRGGLPDPGLVGRAVHFPLDGDDPDPALIAEAAQLLGRPPKYCDDDGYQHEIIAASSTGPKGELAYVTSAFKQLRKYVDVNFKFVVRDALNQETASEIESYNPFFGCDVRLLEWFEGAAVLIYREKHSAYIASCNSEGPARYVVMADQWVINSGQIGYWTYKDSKVKRLRLPQLTKLEPLAEADAIAVGLCPTKNW